MGRNGGMLISATRGVHTGNVSTIRFFDPHAVSICAPWEFFVYLLPFKRYSIFFICLEFPIGGQKIGVLAILDLTVIW